jgi:hypothetical protein
VSEPSAYRERAALVAYLAACHPSVMLTDTAEPDWPIVFVSTPAGQMSWHIAKADLDLFTHVSTTTEPTWDGHTTAQKYQRLGELTANTGAWHAISSSGLIDSDATGRLRGLIKSWAEGCIPANYAYRDDVSTAIASTVMAGIGPYLAEIITSAVIRWDARKPAALIVKREDPL